MTIQQTHITAANTDTTLVTAPVSGQFASVGLILCNYHATSTATVQLYLVNDGGASADEHSIFRDVVIAPKESWVLNVEKFLLATNCAIVAKSDTANAVVATASYMAI